MPAGQDGTVASGTQFGLKAGLSGGLRTKLRSNTAHTGVDQGLRGPQGAGRVMAIGVVIAKRPRPSVARPVRTMRVRTGENLPVFTSQAVMALCGRRKLADNAEDQAG